MTTKETIARHVGVVLSALLLAACTSTNSAPMATVSDFQVERYLGRWHQVAAVPAWFQGDCIANTTANYTLAEDDLIAVRNVCETADGALDQADGWARFQEAPSEGKLEVTFVEVLGEWIWPAAGEYWIIGLDPDYRWSVVGHPSRDYGWILARTPSLDMPTLQDINAILVDQGYDTCTLIMTTPLEQGRLCDLVS